MRKVPTAFCTLWLRWWCIDHCRLFQFFHNVMLLSCYTCSICPTFSFFSMNRKPYKQHSSIPKWLMLGWDCNGSENKMKCTRPKHLQSYFCRLILFPLLGLLCSFFSLCLSEAGRGALSSLLCIIHRTVFAEQSENFRRKQKRPKVYVTKWEVNKTAELIK